MENNQQLFDYIKKQLEIGAREDIIVSSLLSKGWKFSIIQDAFKRLKPFSNDNLEAPFSTKKNVIQNKPILIIFIITFVLIFLSIYLALKDKWSNTYIPDIYNSLNTNSKNNNNCLSSKCPSTDDWEIYNNVNYGYEIKYPKTWTNNKDLTWDYYSAFSSIESGGSLHISLIMPSYLFKLREKYGEDNLLNAVLRDIKNDELERQKFNYAMKIQGIKNDTQNWIKISTETIKTDSFEGIKISRINENNEITDIDYYVIDKTNSYDGIVDTEYHIEYRSTQRIYLISGQFWGENRNKYISDFNQITSMLKFNSTSEEDNSNMSASNTNDCQYGFKKKSTKETGTFTVKGKIFSLDKGYTLNADNKSENTDGTLTIYIATEKITYPVEYDSKTQFIGADRDTDAYSIDRCITAVIKNSDSKASIISPQ